MRKTLGIIFLFVLLFIFEVSFAEKVGDIAPAADIKVGDIAPDFSLESFTGAKVNLKDFRGKIVFLNFFATWCGPCSAEMPDLVKVHSLYKDKNIEFISVDLQEDKKKVSEFINKYNIKWEILLDYKGAVGKLYNIRGIPTNLVINKAGKITFIGHFLTEDVLKTELDKVIRK